ncbi:TetR/AcrR family transcriptional regulator [Bacteroides heparinolyticus]|uniref:TetR/AcrR family transcriptional regulator n=1 Tax=Prevotella heparinolytica TaxID=28113 RepID=UPI00359FDC6B
MSGQTKRTASRAELKERIIGVAMSSFMEHGIKSITMDDIAASLGIPKRTLYEVFPDKETLLEECIRKRQKESDEFVNSILSTTDNVMEVVLRMFLWIIEKYHATNKSFFEDIKKYPKAFQLMDGRRRHDSEETLKFFKEGVRQGLFRDDINFSIAGLLVYNQLDLLMNSDICNQYSFIAVYESIMFTFLRGISTEKGGKMLEDFIREYRKNLINKLNTDL